MTASRVLLSSSLILLASCASQPTPPQPLLVEKQSQCPVTLDVGQAITLALPSNPSTGYRWLLQNPANGGTCGARAPRSTATPKTPAWWAVPAESLVALQGQRQRQRPPAAGVSATLGTGGQAGDELRLRHPGTLRLRRGAFTRGVSEDAWRTLR